MNFEDLQKAWQSQNPGAKVTINTDLLLREVRRNQKHFARTIFWRDVREAGLAYVLAGYFIRHGLWTGVWTNCLIGLACFGVGTFMIVDRWLQRGKPPAANDLVACVEASLHQVNHQIWLLRNIAWWYLLPLALTIGISVTAQVWDSEHATSQLAGLGVYAFFVILLYWFIYWLNQFAVKKTLEPRKRELEALLVETGNPTTPKEMKNPTLKTTIIRTMVLSAVLAMGIILATTPKPPVTPAGQFLEAIRERNDLPALAVVVVKDGTICDRLAVGQRKWGAAEPVTTNDVFHIGGCTQPMTATLVAKLIEEGKLRWDTTIVEVFPEWKDMIDKEYEAVTVEQLLQHRGGIPGPPPPAAWKRAREENGTPTQQRREFIEAVLAEPPVAAPGERMIYANQGYAVIGAMLEKITGQEYEALITERLFKPLHLDTAGFGPPGTRGTIDQPWGHIRRWHMSMPMQADNPPAISPAARVHCSLDDLARFAMFHLQPGTNAFLKPETLARLHAPPALVEMSSPLDNQSGGWVMLQRDWAGGTVWWQNGSNKSWYVVMWVAPKRNFAVIAATNIAGREAEQGCDEAVTAMIEKWLPK